MNEENLKKALEKCGSGIIETVEPTPVVEPVLPPVEPVTPIQPESEAIDCNIKIPKDQVETMNEESLKKALDKCGAGIIETVEPTPVVEPVSPVVEPISPVSPSTDEIDCSIKIPKDQINAMNEESL